jgi:hypothetical protein
VQASLFLLLVAEELSRAFGLAIEYGRAVIVGADA